MSRYRWVVGVVILLAVGLVGAEDEQPAAPDPVRSGGDIPAGGAGSGKAHPLAKGYSPYADRDYPTRPLWGDTHLHTSNSGDAFMAGNRLGPEAAYRLARGEAVTSSTGLRVQLRRPLDWIVVTDHAEGLGTMRQVYEGNDAFKADETLARWSKMMRAGGEEAAAAMAEVILAQSKGTLPKPLTDPKVAGPIFKSVWADHIKTAERFNEPGRFTAMLGYEWTSVPGGNNLHRNVIFRDGPERVGKILPYSSWKSEAPEDLWRALEAYETNTGGRVLAIPHNGNLSNGLMFALESTNGKPLTAELAALRQRFEPLYEVAQSKGASEVHPLLSPTDLFADWGITGWDNGNLTLTDKPETPAMMPFEHWRPALANGLAMGNRLGVNPFKYGAIGGTDHHNSLTAIEEDNFFGKHLIQEPSPERWKHVSKQGLGATRYTWHYLSATRAAVWAKENTREAIWDALKRRECYATSNSRMTLRFFGGWSFGAQDTDTRYLAGVGYSKGVPMGADLPSAPAGKTAPTFLMAALRDPIGANLDRIQIVKGWVDDKGKTHEKIFDVAWGDADRRKPNADGSLPPVGDTVDVANASWTNTIGDSELGAVWTDPSFDPKQPAFYYVRVLEIPTPRWTAYDAKRFGITMPPEVPMKHQGRAWSSPIWYTP